MNDNDRIDVRFDEHLRTLAARTPVEPGPDPRVMQGCLNILQRPTTPNWRTTVQTYRKPILWSSMGMAAMFALFATSLWPHANPTVHAALVVEKLAKQAAANPLMQLTVENLAMDEVQCTAHLQLGKGGIAGDVNVRVESPDDEMPGTIEVEASIGLGGNNNWILIRRLSVPDPKAQFFLNMFLPPGQETLLVLPADSDIGNEVGAEIEEALQELRSGELIEAFKQLLANHAEVGATATNQPDGTIRLTLPIQDEEAIEAVVNLFHKGEGEEHQDGETPPVAVEKKINKSSKTKSHAAQAHKAIEKHHAKHVEDGAKELIGATVNAVYDPATETVRMLEVLGLGSPNARISLVLSEGDVDANLLDSARVAKPGVRTLDLGAIESIIKSFEGMHDKK